MTSVEAEINKLRDLIQELEIATRCEISVLQSKVNKLSTRTRSTNTVTPASAESRHYTGQVDRDQHKIFIGDTVDFLTTGRFDSSQGVVSGYTTTHVIATDYKNREIKRASHNVRVDRQSK